MNYQQSKFYLNLNFLFITFITLGRQIFVLLKVSKDFKEDFSATLFWRIQQKWLSIWNRNLGLTDEKMFFCLLEDAFALRSLHTKSLHMFI